MDNIYFKECPLCSGQEIVDFIAVKDHSVSKESFTISKCKECTLLFTNPIPHADEISHYYKSETYISHTNKANNIINFLYTIVRKFTIKRKLSILKKLGGRSLLDIGAGTGLFLEEASKAGYEINGVEIDATARKNMSQTVVYQTVESLRNLPEGKTYDIISLWHVLEHLHDLQEQFSKIVQKLKPGGNIIIAVPNSDSWDKCHYQEYWAAWDVPRHLYHFNKKSISTLFQQHKLTLTETKPMVFDSIYVSMLSEKYKGRSAIIQLILGSLTGIFSNLRSKKNNYSSLIFIGKKDVA